MQTFIYLNTLEPSCEKTLIMLYNLTSHLGDSGMKNRPKSCIIQGIAPGFMFYFRSITHTKQEIYKGKRKEMKILPITANRRQLMITPTTYISDAPQHIIS